MYNGRRFVAVSGGSTSTFYIQKDTEGKKEKEKSGPSFRLIVHCKRLTCLNFEQGDVCLPLAGNTDVIGFRTRWSRTRFYTHTHLNWCIHNAQKGEKEFHWLFLPLLLPLLLFVVTSVAAADDVATTVCYTYTCYIVQPPTLPLITPAHSKA